MQETCSIYSSWSQFAPWVQYVLQHYIVKLQNSQTRTPSRNVSWKNMLLHQGLGFPRAPVCWWPELSSVRCPSEAVNCSDEMKSLRSLPKLLREICMAMFWQPVALNHCFMTARENVSVFPPLIYVHWSLENMIIWLEQMDRDTKGLLCQTLSCAAQMESTCWRKTLTSLFISSTSCPSYNELHLCSMLQAEIKSHNS